MKKQSVKPLVDIAVVPMTYSDIFVDNPKSIKEYILPIGRTHTLQLCAQFCSEISMKEQDKNLLSFLTTNFSYVCKKYANELCPFLVKHTTPTDPDYYFLSPTNLYYIMEIAMTLNDDIGVIKAEECEEYFFKACLVANDIFLEKIKKLQSIPLEDNKLSLYKLILAGNSGYCSYMGRDINFVFLTQTARCYFFFYYLEQKEKELLNRFLTKYAITSWHQYIEVLTKELISVTKYLNEREVLWIQEEKHSLGEMILSNYAQYDNTGIDEDFDFCRLRKAPLYKQPNGQYLVLSKLFFAECLYNGLYFEIKTLYEELNHSNNFRSLIGEKFSEEKVFYPLIERIFPSKGVIKLSGQTFRKQGCQAEPDYYVRNGNKIFLFESKDTLCSSETKTSYCVETILDVLRERFYKQNKKPKAIRQLLRNIEKIGNDGIESPNNIRNARIYPIIVVYDSFFDTNYVNYFLDQWFQEELQNRALGVKIQKVYPIVVVSIDILIMLDGVLGKPKARLEDILLGYIDNILMSNKVGLYSFSEYALKYTQSQRSVPRCIKDFVSKVPKGQ